MLAQIGVDSSYFLIDASGNGALVCARNWYSDAALRGKRALLCLNAERGLGNGYAKVCAGSGQPERSAVQNFLKSESKLRAWGKPDYCVAKEFKSHCSSAKLSYERIDDGRTESWQCGSWIERQVVSP